MWTAKGTQGLEDPGGQSSRWVTPRKCTLLGTFYRNEKQPVISYGITKINMEQTEFIGVEKILNRKECVQEGAVVNNVEGSEDFLKNHSPN